MAIKIEVPNKNFNGEHGGLTFVNGVAIAEDEKHGRAVAVQLGYKVIEDKPKEAAAEVKPKPKPASRKKPKGDE